MTRRLLDHRLLHTVVRVGDCSVRVVPPKAIHLVPRATTSPSAALPAPSSVAALRWMAQKESLRQDCLLIGPPGSQRRRLALWWAALARREVEYLALSSDTTDAELKQRREVIHGSVEYIDAPPVRAALSGRLLLLDGVEKAERNVLPTLNNLLENREMGLPDGRFLCSPHRFDQLLREGHDAEALMAQGLVRVHEAFRVIAIGLPVPAFAGFPLDPPLRSRFQGLYLGVPPIPEQLATARSQLAAPADAALPAVAAAGSPAVRGRHSGSTALALVSWAESVRAAAHAGDGQAEGRLLHLGAEAVERATRVLQIFPNHYAPAEPPAPPPEPSPRLPKRHLEATGPKDKEDALPLAALLARAYPQRIMGLDTPELAALTAAFKGAGLSELASAGLAEESGAPSFSSSSADSAPAPIELQAEPPSETEIGLAPARVGETFVSLQVGSLASSSQRLTASTSAQQPRPNGWIRTAALDGTLRAMAEDHAVGANMCLVGSAGSGKSMLISQLSAELGYTTQLVPLYRDMTSQDLLQRRRLDELGNTSWELTPVVEAALTGSLAVLDGLHRLRPDGLVALQRLLSDGETVLFDGTRLLTHTHYDALRAELGVSPQQMSERSLLRVHPSFRVVALAEPPTSANRWLTSEILALFSWHQLPSIAADATAAKRWLSLACPRLHPEAAESLVRVARALEAMGAGGDLEVAAGSSGGGRGGGGDGETALQKVGMEASSHSGGLTLSARQLLRVAKRAEASVPWSGALRDANVPTAQLLAVLEGVRRSVVAGLMSPALASDLEQRMAKALPALSLSGSGVSSVSGGGESSSAAVSATADEATTELTAAEEGDSSRHVEIAIDENSGTLSIGRAVLPLGVPSQPELVPDIAFTDNAAHLRLLEGMALDLACGERALLLIGSQGTGKNKLADRLLQLSRRERQYMQLHRVRGSPCNSRCDNMSCQRPMSLLPAEVPTHFPANVPAPIPASRLPL